MFGKMFENVRFEHIMVVGAAVFFTVTYVMGRFMLYGSMEKLSEGVRSTIIKGVSKIRTARLISTVALFALLFIPISIKSLQPYTIQVFVVYFVLVVANIVLISYLTYRKLKALEAPEEYIRSNLLSVVIYFIGLAVFLAAVFFFVINGSVKFTA